MERACVLEAAGCRDEGGVLWEARSGEGCWPRGGHRLSGGRRTPATEREAASFERPPDHVEAGAMEEVADVVGLEVASFGRPDPVEASALEEAAGCWEGGGRRRHGTGGGVVELAPSTDLCQGRP